MARFWCLRTSVFEGEKVDLHAGAMLRNGNHMVHVKPLSLVTTDLPTNFPPPQFKLLKELQVQPPCQSPS